MRIELSWNVPRIKMLYCEIFKNGISHSRCQMPDVAAFIFLTQIFQNIWYYGFGHQRYWLYPRWSTTACQSRGQTGSPPGFPIFSSRYSVILMVQSMSIFFFFFLLFHLHILDFQLSVPGIDLILTFAVILNEDSSCSSRCHPLLMLFFLSPSPHLLDCHLPIPLREGFTKKK